MRWEIELNWTKLNSVTNIHYLVLHGWRDICFGGEDEMWSREGIGEGPSFEFAFTAESKHWKRICTGLASTQRKYSQIPAGRCEKFKNSTIHRAETSHLLTGICEYFTLGRG